MNDIKRIFQCFMEHDPAARSPIEIVLLYPGFKALRNHCKAQWFCKSQNAVYRPLYQPAHGA